MCFEHVRFSAFLNSDKLPQYLIAMGSAFRNRGPTTRNDRPNLTVSFSGQLHLTHGDFGVEVGGNATIGTAIVLIKLVHR